MQTLCGVDQGVPILCPRMPVTDDGTGTETFRLGPRKLVCPKLSLRNAIGQVKTHRNGLGLQLVA